MLLAIKSSSEAIVEHDDSHQRADHHGSDAETGLTKKIVDKTGTQLLKRNREWPDRVPAEQSQG